MEEALGVEDRLSESAFSGVSHGSDIMVSGIFSDPATQHIWVLAKPSSWDATSVKASNMVANILS
jgi:hypothetical protein